MIGSNGSVIKKYILARLMVPIWDQHALCRRRFALFGLLRWACNWSLCSSVFCIMPHFMRSNYILPFGGRTVVWPAFCGFILKGIFEQTQTVIFILTETLQEELTSHGRFYDLLTVHPLTVKYEQLLHRNSLSGWCFIDFVPRCVLRCLHWVLSCWFSNY